MQQSLTRLKFEEFHIPMFYGRAVDGIFWGVGLNILVHYYIIITLPKSLKSIQCFLI